jgi:hypothetical protein
MLAVTTIARAELTPQQFGQVRDWANREGYIYHGIETSACWSRSLPRDRPQPKPLAIYNCGGRL